MADVMVLRYFVVTFLWNNYGGESDLGLSHTYYFPTISASFSGDFPTIVPYYCHIIPEPYKTRLYILEIARDPWGV